MNKLWQQLAIATNWPVLVAVGVLSSLGLLSIWGVSQTDGVRQLVFLGVAISCMALFQAVDYRLIGKLSWAFYVLSLLLVLYTVIGGALEPHGMPLPGVRNIKGACNWIKFGSFSLQPAELMKVSFILVLARYLRFRSNYRTLKGLIPPFLLALVPLALILKQPDLGTALVFIPILFAMLFVAGARISHLLAIVLMGAALVPVAWMAGKDAKGNPNSRVPGFQYLPTMVKDYQRARVHALFAGDNDPAALKKENYQTDKAITALASGGPTGKGAGHIPVGRRVPEGQNDMVFALIGEQFGVLGSAVVLGAYIVLFAAGIEISASTREPFGKLIALGIVAMLAGQTFINLLVATRLMPVTGITLPFVSYGGSSLMASYMAAGLLLNVGQIRPIVMAREAFEF
jgi:cell division protein FtsW (lipid II flippase)